MKQWRVMVSNRLILREGRPARPIELSRPVAEALASTGIAQVVPTSNPGVWEVSAGNQVGVARVGDLQVVIQPKVAIQRLVFMLGYAMRPDHWRGDLVSTDPDLELPDALTDAFLTLARRALDQGLLKGYVTVDESLQVLRGRVREAEQLRRRFGRSVPLEVRYDEYSVDIPENQILLAAAERLLRTPGVGARHRGGLQRLRLQLADVSLTARGTVPSWMPSRLNARYVPALEVAELILNGRSFEQRAGDLVVTGYLLNMAKIFEDFVTVALREAFRLYGGRSRLQYVTNLDEDETVEVRPDFVWLHGGTPRVVVDAKYKAEKPSGFPQADLYQMLAYCTVLGLTEGHLVYAKGLEPARTHVVRRAGVRILAHTLDLEAEPQAIIAEMQRMARRFAGSPVVGELDDRHVYP